MPPIDPRWTPEQILYGQLPGYEKHLSFAQQQRLKHYLEKLQQDREEYSRGYKIILETISDVLTDQELRVGMYPDKSDEYLRIYKRLDTQAAKTDGAVTGRVRSTKPTPTWPGRTNPGWIQSACALEAWQRKLISFEELEELSDIKEY